MSDIKVNTDDLRSNSSTLQKAASELAASITQISAASAFLNPSKYQGQFTSKVQGDISQVQGSINQFQNRLTELGSELSTRANAFEIANEDSSGRVLGLSITMTDFTSSSSVMSASANMRQINTGKANSIWALGGSILGGLMGWLTNLPPFAWFMKHETPPQPQQEEMKKNIPTPVPLNDIPRVVGESCAEYAQRKRTTNLGPITELDLGAYNYKNRPGVFQISNDDKDLTKSIARGYAVIWDKGHPDLKNSEGALSGHVAIVEAVEGDKSQSI